MYKIKNLYLPGTNKNVGYLTKDTMHIYPRAMKYLPWLANGQLNQGVPKFYPFILATKNKKIETNLKIDYTGWIHNSDSSTYDFYNCTFTVPDNLDVIEMAYLYKHWKVK